VGTGRLGVSNTVLSLSRQDKLDPFEFEGHMVHRVPLNAEIASNAISVQSIGALARLAKQADVVHYHFPWPFMDLAHFMARVDKPTVVTYHSDIVRQRHLLRLYQPLKHRFLKSVDAIVATSPNYLGSSTVLARYKEKTTVIPFGLDRGTYPQPEPGRLAHWRERVGPKFFLFVGVLRYYKGLHVLLEAARGLDYPIVIVGTGPEEQALREQAARLGLKHVIFTGGVDDADKAALLSLCHAMAFPSHLRAESFGISLLEAAMYGKPMISCEIGSGTTYINQHGETGLVVPPSDAAALRGALQALWNDTEMARRMGVRAEQRYHELFTSEQMAANYTALYHELVAKRAAQNGDVVEMPVPAPEPESVVRVEDKPVRSAELSETKA